MGTACPSYPSNAPASYVLELNAGQAANMGLKDGATLKIDPKLELKANAPLAAGA